MAFQQHKDNVTQYLRKHAKGTKTTDRKQSKTSPAYNNAGTSSKVLAPKARPRGKPWKPISFINDLPDEMLLKIFTYLGADTLMLGSCVCKKWLHLCNDKILWRKIQTQCLPADKLNKTTPTVGEVKKHCMKKNIAKREKFLQNLSKKINIYTGLPRDIVSTIKKLGIGWLLSFTDTSDRETFFECNTVENFQLGSTIRWYSVGMPSLSSISKLKIYATIPIFVDNKLNGQRHSPHQRSLIVDFAFKWSDIETKFDVCSASDILNIRILPHNIMLATFKDGGELAFITLSIHHCKVMDRSLKGFNSKIFKSPFQAQFDDIDSERGLHDYQCTLELRNHKASIWHQQFRNLFCKKQNIDGSIARLTLINPENTFDRCTVSKRISLPWKTDLFKGILSDLTIMDIILLDEDSKPFWCVSTPVNIQDDTKIVLYEYDGQLRKITYGDDIASVDMQLVWEPEVKQYMMIGLFIDISLTAINLRFLTGY